MGEVLDAPTDNHKNGWGAARILDASVAQVTHSLSTGKLWLPATLEPIDLPMVRLSEVGELGVHDSMLTMTTHKGPFTKDPPSPTATYPSLYNHHASRETRLICMPDSQMRVRQGMEKRAAELWAKSSRTHINRDFRLNSQPLAVAFTDHRSIGGTVWPNIIFRDERFDFALAIWGNSTLGLMAYWWNSSRQQNGRGRMTRQLIPFLPILDFGTLTDDQLVIAELIFEEFRSKDLKPAYLADADPNRALLDRRVVCDLLEFDESVYEAIRRLSAKWCAEPSVHGGKPRPKDAGLVV